jgi:hypothetical protein
MAVTSVDQSRSAELRKEVNPDPINKLAQGKINPLSSKESLQGRVTALTSKSENLKDGATALTFLALFAGILGLINPLFLLAALGFLAGAAVCDIESNEASREADEAQSQLKSIEAKEILLNAEFKKLLNGESAQFEEHGIFRPQEFHAMIERNQDFHFGAFSSYGDYPYEIPGVVKSESESLPDAIVRHFVEQATSLDVNFAQRALNLDGAKLPQSKTRQMCAFLKLLGDRDSHINTNINGAISKIDSNVTLKALKTGKLTTDCPTDKLGKEEIKFNVENEEVGLYYSESTVPFARYKTSRVVTVSAPDSVGNVHYTILRTFTRSKDLHSGAA